MNTFLKKLRAVWGRTRTRVIAAAMVSTILASTLTGITFATNVVYIYDQEDVLKLYTTDSTLTAEEILLEEGLTLSAADKVDFTGFDESGRATLTIHRAFTVTVTADGASKTVTLTEGSVADALERAGVTLSRDDLINVSPYEDAVSGMEIIVNRITYRTVEKETDLPFTTETTETEWLTAGKVLVTQPGKDGKQVATYHQVLMDGEVIDSELLDSKVLSYPVVQKQYLGTSSTPIASEIIPPSDFKLDENGIPENYTRVLSGKATAYSSRRYPYVRGASGQYLKPGSVAVDPKLIPYGTKLYITSADGSYVYGYAIAADTGLGMVQGHVLVDCFFETYGESCRFGAKKVNVYVLP